MVIDETELEGLTEDQRDAYIALKEGRNVFLSGNAGTGKSYVLNRFIDDLEARSVPYTAMAPTGIAALNMHNGSTIHRTLQVSAGVCNPSEKIRPRKVLTVAEVIIIDEISMCRIDLFDYVMPRSRPVESRSCSSVISSSFPRSSRKMTVRSS